jgi:hypothetical protein
MSAFTGTDDRTNAATKYKTINIMKTPSALDVALMIPVNLSQKKFTVFNRSKLVNSL